MRNANGVGNYSADGNSGTDPNREIRGPSPAGVGRGWAAIYLAAKFEKALVVLEANRAAAGAVDCPELVRDRAQAG